MNKFSYALIFCYVLFLFENSFGQFVPKKLNEKTQMDVNDSRTFDQALYFIELGDFIAALPLFEELVELYPSEPLIKYLLAQCYLKENTEEKEALPLLEELKRNYPQSGELYYWLGKSKPFFINGEYKLELLFIDKVNHSAKIQITNLKTKQVQTVEVPNE